MTYKCPFDQTDLTKLQDAMCESYFFCENCHQEYSRYEVERLPQVREERIDSAKLELARLSKRSEELVRLLTLAQTSRKCTEPATLDFQTAREAEEKIIQAKNYGEIAHLADHLFNKP